MKFFVYANKTDVKNPELKVRSLYFVPETEMRAWATSFDPNIIEFCGVSVCATSREEAQEAFLTPIEHDGFNKMIAEDEPLLTRYQRQKKQEFPIVMELLTERLVEMWQEIDELFQAMAGIYALEDERITKEEAYKRYKKEWLKRYEKM